MAARAPAPKPEGLHDVGEDARDHRPLAALATHPPSLASNTFRRQTSKVGAGCLNWARPVLCGGRSVMSVPTAMVYVTVQFSIPPRSCQLQFQSSAFDPLPNFPRRRVRLAEPSYGKRGALQGTTIDCTVTIMALLVRTRNLQNIAQRDSRPAFLVLPLGCPAVTPLLAPRLAQTLDLPVPNFEIARVGVSGVS